jgi:hypothetical protein
MLKYGGLQSPPKHWPRKGIILFHDPSHVTKKNLKERSDAYEENKVRPSASFPEPSLRMRLDKL